MPRVHILWLPLALVLWPQCAGSAVARENDGNLAASEKPYFEDFSVNIPHHEDKRQVVYDQGFFAVASQPRLALNSDGRMFIAINYEIGFARGERVVGSFSRDGGRTWSEAIELINNPDKADGDPVIIVDGKKLMVITTSAPLPEKWDKFNPWPVKYDRTWWYIIESDDNGKTWSTPINAVHPHLCVGHRSNGIALRDGTLLLPYYYDVGSKRGNIPKLERDMRSISEVARSTDGGKTWVSGQGIESCGADDCDEPAVVSLSNGHLYCLMRTNTDHLYESHSHDDGRTWDTPKPSAILSGKNDPFALCRLETGGDDQLVAAWNYPDRSSLVAAYSPDGGKTWTNPRVVARNSLETRYRVDNPSICQTKDGIILIAYQHETLPHHLGKEARIARVNRAWLTQK